MRGERATISKLNGRVSADLKKLLKPASGFLSDAEGCRADYWLRQNR